MRTPTFQDRNELAGVDVRRVEDEVRAVGKGVERRVPEEDAPVGGGEALVRRSGEHDADRGAEVDAAAGQVPERADDLVLVKDIRFGRNEIAFAHIDVC